ncbi:MAG: hypothetical protein AB7J28_14940 [Hyphomonadaceae bacterium]
MRHIPLVVLALLGVLNLVRGAIHAFAPDGGAHSIAGLDLSEARETILALFAAIGLMQMTLGAFQLFVVARMRALISLFLALQAVQTALTLANLYLWRSLPVEVPGQPFNAAALVIILIALAISLKTRATPPA